MNPSHAQNIEAAIIILRPKMLGFAARMMGNRFDGEDIVQDVILRALSVRENEPEIDNLSAWLMAATHHRAIDVLRARKRQHAQKEESQFLSELAQHNDQIGVVEALVRQEMVVLALGHFAHIGHTGRAMVILKDVLGLSTGEIAAITGATTPAIKAQLHKGRAALKNRAAQSGKATPANAQDAALLGQYAQLFNLRQWTKLADMLAENVRLTQHRKSKLDGKQQVQQVFLGTYGALSDWSHLAPILVDNIWCLGVFLTPEDSLPAYAMRLDFSAGQVVAINDYRYARELFDGLANE